MASTAQTGPVSLSEALERLLPLFNNKVHKVATWLDQRHRDGDLQLLAGDIVIAPATNPSMLGVVARGLPDGRTVLYVQVRKGLNIDCPVWDGENEDALCKHQAFWSYGRTTFETIFPVPVDRGGRPPKYDPAEILIEAAVAIYEDGPPKPSTIEGWVALIQRRLGDQSPGEGLLKKVLAPLNRRMKAIMNKD
jgi:hypothetical protein